MKAPLSKLALAVVLLNSSIYISAGNDDYLEDDLSYTSVSEMQSDGWHWGLNSANACGGETDYTNCIEVNPDPGTEIDPWESGGGDGFDDPNDPGDGDIGSGDGDSGSGSGGDGNTPGELDQCIATIDAEYNWCEEVALENYLAELDYCNEMTQDPYATYDDIQDCEDERNYTYSSDQQQCSSRRVDDINYCNANFEN